MYQPSVDCKPLVQAQHRPSAKIQELSTNDLSFTLDGVLSTLQQGSAENGVGSPVELRYHVKKRRAQICDQIQRFIKIPTGLHRKTRTPNASAERIVANLITLKCTVVSRKLFHPRLPHADVELLLFAPDATRSVTGKHKQNKQEDKTTRGTKRDNVFPLSVCLMSS